MIRPKDIIGLPLRSYAIMPAIGVVTAYCGSAAVVFSYVDPKGRIGDTISRIWSHVLAGLAGLGVTVTGIEHVRRGTSYVIVTNHQSHMDTIALYLTSPVPIRMLAKTSLFKIPFFGPAMKRLGHVPVVRKDRTAKDDQLLTDGVKKLLERGQSVVVFAEGTRSPDHRVHGFKKGAFRLATEFSLPILPVTIDGTWRVLPPRTLAFSKGEARVTIHPPIDPAGRTVDDLLDETRRTVMAPLGQEE